MTLELTSASDVVALLKKLSETPEIQSITFRQVCFDQNVCSALMTTMMRSDKPYRKWRHIVFDDCSGQIEIPIATFTFSDTVTKFTFRPCLEQNTSMALSAALSVASSLTSLRLDARLTMENCEALADALSGDTKLKELNLSLIEIDIEAVTLLSQGLSKNKHLKKFSLNNCKLTDDLVADIVKGLARHDSLEELDLGYNQCHTATLVWVTYLLRSKTCKLTRLSLEYQDLGVDVLNVSQIADALKLNKSLKELDLSGNKLDNDDVDQLAESLQYNGTLECLHLWNNNVTDSGAKTFAEQIPHMQGLKKVFFGNNPFGKDGTTYLLRGLELNDALQFVGLPHFSWVREMAI